MLDLYRIPILKTLSYFHVFQYPLTAEEIRKFLPVKISLQQTQETLGELATAGEIYKVGSFYALVNDAMLAERRIKGNRFAEKRIAKARRIARFLGNFPFVESVFISGSLSKDFSTPEGDLDFFIVTAKDRLWIARTLMHFFKKLTFLAGAQHSFCMNYYVSMEHMEINPKNMFTATELSTLKPAFVRNGVKELYEYNRYWIKLYLPNMQCFDTYTNNMHDKWLPTRMFEAMLDKLGATAINKFFYNTTRKKWMAKWERKEYDVDKCMPSMDLHYCTPINHPKNLPEKIMANHQRIYAEAIGRGKGNPATISS